jgi:hypothetical protein
MNSGILPGVIRGLGKARIRFDLAYKNRKIGSEYSKKYSFLEKLNLKEREFSRSALFKTLKFFSEPEPDEVLFWTVLKLINAEEVGGLCYPKEELKKFILEKNKTLEPEKSWEKYFANPSTDLLFEEEGRLAALGLIGRPHLARMIRIVAATAIHTTDRERVSATGHGQCGRKLRRKDEGHGVPFWEGEFMRQCAIVAHGRASRLVKLPME